MTSNIDTNAVYQLTFTEIKNALIVREYYLQGFDDDVLSEGQWVENWPSNMEVIVQGKNPPDNLFCPLKPWLLVSKKVKATFEESKIIGVQFLPIKVTHQSGIEIPGYSILNITEMIEGLDFENTSWLTQERWNVEYPSLDILEIALRKSVIHNKDIFRIKEQKTKIFISEHVKNCMEKNNVVSGFSFIPVKVF